MIAAYENGIDFSNVPFVYWSDTAKIDYLQRRVIIYSIMYYELNESCVTDKAYDAIARQLETLQNASEYADLKASQYYYAMYDFDASTGFDIASRLNANDRHYLTQLAAVIIKQWKNNDERSV